MAEASKRVWTSGCIEIVRLWGERHLYTIASVALGVALSQLFVIYLAKTLEGQIELQKARYNFWTRIIIYREIAYYSTVLQFINSKMYRCLS